MAWGRLDITFDWNAHYLLNAFSSQDSPRMGIVRYWCTRASASGKKKKKELRQSAKAEGQYEGSTKSGSAGAPLRCPPLGLPLQRQSDFLPSSQTADTPHEVLIQLHLRSSISSVLAVSHTRGSRTLIHPYTFPQRPLPPAPPLKAHIFS